MNIYVGNLSYTASDESLKDMFSQFGTIENAKVIADRFTGRSKGFGFVEMPNNSEAEEAIRELNGKLVDGRNIKVNQSKPAGSGGSGGSGRPSSGRPYQKKY